MLPLIRDTLLQAPLMRDYGFRVLANVVLDAPTAAEVWKDERLVTAVRGGCGVGVPDSVRRFAVIVANNLCRSEATAVAMVQGGADIATPVVQMIVQNNNDDTDDAILRRYALGALDNMTKPPANAALWVAAGAVPALITRLGDFDVDLLQVLACSCLAHLMSQDMDAAEQAVEGGLDALQKVLEGDNPRLHWLAAKTLGAADRTDELQARITANPRVLERLDEIAASAEKTEAEMPEASMREMSGRVRVLVGMTAAKLRIPHAEQDKLRLLEQAQMMKPPQ